MERIIDFLSFKIPVVLESLITPLVNCRGDMIVSAVKHQCPWIKKLFFCFISLGIVQIGKGLGEEELISGNSKKSTTRHKTSESPTRNQESGLLFIPLFYYSVRAYMLILKAELFCHCFLSVSLHFAFNGVRLRIKL